MNQYDARQQFIEGLDRYVSGIETDDRLQRLATNVSAYHSVMVGASRTATQERPRFYCSACARSHRKTASPPARGSDRA